MGGCLTPSIPEASAIEEGRKINKQTEMDEVFGQFFTEVSENAKISNIVLKHLQNGGLQISSHFTHDKVIFEIAKRLYYVFIFKFKLLDETMVAVIGFHYVLPLLIEWALRPKVFLKKELRQQYMDRVEWTKKAAIMSTPNSSIEKYIHFFILSDAICCLTMLLMLSSDPGNQNIAKQIFDNGVDEMAGTVTKAKEFVNFVNSIPFSDVITKKFKKDFENKVIKLTTVLSATNQRQSNMRNILPFRKRGDNTFRPCYDRLIEEWNRFHVGIIPIVHGQNILTRAENIVAEDAVKNLVADTQIVALVALACAFELHDKYVVNKLETLSRPFSSYYCILRKKAKYKTYFVLHIWNR